MNNPNHKETLLQVVNRVLEQAAFIFADESGELSRIDPYALSFVKVSLNFDGAHTGQTILIVPKDLCGEFAMNMLGCEPEECASEEIRIDAGKEIANMVTGQLLTELFGTKAVINLSAPDAVELPSEEFFATLDANDYVCAMVDDRPVIAILSEVGAVHEHQSTHS